MFVACNVVIIGNSKRALMVLSKGDECNRKVR